MDFRLGSVLRDYMNENNLYDDCDIISLAGAAKDLVDDPNGYLANQIDLSIKLHQTKTIILMHHTDCGGYGGRDQHETAEAEHDFHIDQMKQAQATLNQKYPEVDVKLMLADIKEGGRIEIEAIK